MSSKFFQFLNKKRIYWAPTRGGKETSVFVSQTLFFARGTMCLNEEGARGSSKLSILSREFRVVKNRPIIAPCFARKHDESCAELLKLEFRSGEH